MIVAVVFCRFFFSGSCFASVEWRWYMLNGLFFMLLLVVVFIQWLRQCCCLKEVLFIDRPVFVVAPPCMLFFHKKLKKCNLQEKTILLCLFDGVVFCSTACFFLQSFEGTPC